MTSTTTINGKTIQMPIMTDDQMPIMTDKQMPIMTDKKRKRFEWLARRARDETFIDVLNADLVDDYVDAFGLKCDIVPWGANICPQLGRDLSEMAKRGYLKRNRTGLSSGAWQPGFPKWVWSYRLGSYAEHIIDE